jgi:eukaryotic-like serine/threonine-protein kinase
MATDGWTDVEALFAAAVELPVSERARLLDARCASDPALRAEVEALLAAHDNAGDFLDAPPPLPSAGPEPPEDLTGRTVGPFRLLEAIGRGGMGVVYRAERTGGDFSQRVAVKVIDAPVRSPEILRRFKSERQILAVLNHPHIVALLDGGVSEDGCAYLAMEYVEGLPITTHAATARLSLDARLRLVQSVCSAVQYAHQHAVVHRDLKPANILVTPDGEPKVLDFGVAKLVDPAEPGADATVTGLLRPLTPNYASPEQLRGLPVTTAADLYALGVLLYELLTGERPYETSGKPLDEVLRLVTEREPRRPSAAATGVPYDRRLLRGDLDAVVLKAMDKQPARRYASAQELSDDLARCLDGRPVLAREPSLRYLIGKAARRHRAAFIGGAIAVAALVTALTVSLWERRIALNERDLAAARFSDVRQIADAMIFKIDTAVAPLPGSTPIRQQIVAEGLQYLERLSRDASRDDALSMEMARAYHRIGDVQGNESVPNLGDRRGAISSYQRAIDLLRPLVERPAIARDATLELGRVDLSLATVAEVSGDHGGARTATADAARVAESLVARDGHDDGARRLVASAEFQAALLAGDPQSLPHWQHAGEIFRALLAEKPDDVDRQRNVALVEKYLGAYYERKTDYAAALAHHLQAQALDERRLEAQPMNRLAQFDVAIDLGNVAYAHWLTGHLADAAAGYERSLKMREQLAESDPQDVLARSRVAYVHAQLERVYGEMGRAAPALAHAREAVRLGESLAGLDPAHQSMLADDLEALGDAEQRLGHAAEACAAFRRSLALATTALSSYTSDTTRNIVAGDTARLAACGPR